MAKKKLSSVSLYVKNMTIKDILDLDPMAFGGMSEANIRHITTRLGRHVMSKINKITKIPYGPETPAYYALAKDTKFNKGVKTIQTGKGKSGSIIIKGFSIKGLTKQETRKLYHRMRAFLSSETGSVEGIEKLRMKFAQRTGAPMLNERRMRRFWRVYRKLEGRLADLFMSLRGKDTDIIQKALMNFYKLNSGTMSDAQLVERMEQMVDEYVKGENMSVSMQSLSYKFFKGGK